MKIRWPWSRTPQPPERPPTGAEIDRLLAQKILRESDEEVREKLRELRRINQKFIDAGLP